MANQRNVRTQTERGPDGTVRVYVNTSRPITQSTIHTIMRRGTICTFRIRKSSFLIGDNTFRFDVREEDYRRTIDGVVPYYWNWFRKYLVDNFPLKWANPNILVRVYTGEGAKGGAQVRIITPVSMTNYVPQIMAVSNRRQLSIRVDDMEAQPGGKTLHLDVSEEQLAHEKWDEFEAWLRRHAMKKAQTALEAA